MGRRQEEMGCGVVIFSHKERQRTESCKDAEARASASPHAEEDGKRHGQLRAAARARARAQCHPPARPCSTPHVAPPSHPRKARASLSARAHGSPLSPPLTWPLPLPLGGRESPGRGLLVTCPRLCAFSTTALLAPTARIRRYGCRCTPRLFPLPTVSLFLVPPASLRSAGQQRPAHQGCPSPGYSHFLQGNGSGGHRAQGNAHPWVSLGTEGWLGVVCNYDLGASHHRIGLVDSRPTP